MKNRYVPNYRLWHYDEEHLAKDSMSQLLGKYVGVDEWLRSIGSDPDFTMELEEAKARLQRVRSHIVKHIVQVERKELVPVLWDWDYNVKEGHWKYEDEEVPPDFVSQPTDAEAVEAAIEAITGEKP